MYDSVLEKYLKNFYLDFPFKITPWGLNAIIKILGKYEFEAN